MLIMCLFSLSAILAPVLIAIYILQHFTLGKEPTLMVPNWQNRAVKRQTICCLLRGAGQHWRLCVYTCVRACAWCACLYTCMCACCVCMDAHSCVRERPWGRGRKQGGIRAFIPCSRDPCPPWPLLPPGLSSRPRRSAGAPGRHLSLREAETTGSLPALGGSAHFHCKYFCSNPKEAALGTHHSYNGGVLSQSPPGP